MDLSLFLAQLFGVLYFTVGLGMTLQRGHYQSMFSQIVQSPPMMYLSGVFALLFGFSIATIHNVWIQDWRLVITLIGWIAMIKGFVILVFPQMFHKHVQFWMQYIKVAGIVAIALGLIFGYFGFFVG